MTDESSHRTRPFTRIGVAVRIGFTLLALYLFYASYRLMRAAIVPSPPRSYAADAFSRRASDPPPRPRDPVTPWPRYPGSRQIAISRVAWNGIPIVNEQIEVSASNQRILSFFKSRMYARGWAENTEDFFRLRPDVFLENGMPPNLQDEQYLRRYDEIMQSQLSLQKRDESVLIQILPGSRPTRRLVSLKYVQAPSIFEITTGVNKTASRNRRSGSPGVLFEGVEQLGRDTYTSRFYASKDSVDDLYAELENQLQSAGWRSIDAPSVPASATTPGSRVACYMRGQDFATLMIEPNPLQGGSRALVTTIAGIPKK